MADVVISVTVEVCIGHIRKLKFKDDAISQISLFCYSATPRFNYVSTYSIVQLNHSIVLRIVLFFRSIRVFLMIIRWATS